MISLNVQILQDLAELSPDGNRFVVALLIKFLKNTSNLLQELKKYEQSDDFDSVKKTAHYLKSSSGNLGAAKLSWLCSELQNISIEDVTKEKGRSLVEQILLEWIMVEKEMKLEILKFKTP